jgi:hypothetical protein
MATFSFVPERIEVKKGAKKPYELDVDAMESFMAGEDMDDDLHPIFTYAFVADSKKDGYGVDVVVDDSDFENSGGDEVWYVWDFTEAFVEARKKHGDSAANALHEAKMAAIAGWLAGRIDAASQKYGLIAGDITAMYEQDVEGWVESISD